MINLFDIWSTQLTFFVLLNWVLTVVSTAAFVAIHWRWRFLFVKPSMVLLSMAHLLFQWPLAFYAGYYETWLPTPYALVLLVHGFVILGLMGSILIFPNAARWIWSDLGRTPSIQDARISFGIVASLFVACAVGAAVYLNYVPWECTGLYAMVFDPASQPLARELSMKLQTEAMPRYTMSIMQSSIVPLMAAFVSADIFRGADRRASRLFVMVVALIAACCLAFIPGAKGTLVSFTLVIIATYLWTDRLRFNPVTTPPMLGAALVPALVVATLFSFGLHSESARDIRSCFSLMHVALPASPEELKATLGVEISRPVLSTSRSVLTPTADPVSQGGAQEKYFQTTVAPAPAPGVSRWVESRLVDGRNLIDATISRISFVIQKSRAQIGGVVFRAVVVPFEVGGWYIHHLQTAGPIGIAGISRLARRVGVTEVDVPNLIGQKYGEIYYGHAVAPTISASAGFLFSYYSYFGLWALPLILMGCWLTDIAIPILRLLHGSLVLPVLAALSIATLKFTESDYTAVWLTHGFGVILLMGLCLTLFLRRGTWKQSGLQL